MRWPSPHPQYGDTREVRRFLFLPLTLPLPPVRRTALSGFEERTETRWLEWASIHQTYLSWGQWGDSPHWEDDYWVEDSRHPKQP